MPRNLLLDACANPLRYAGGAALLPLSEGMMAKGKVKKRKKAFRKARKVEDAAPWKAGGLKSLSRGGTRR